MITLKLGIAIRKGKDSFDWTRIMFFKIMNTFGFRYQPMVLGFQFRRNQLGFGFDRNQIWVSVNRNPNRNPYFGEFLSFWKLQKSFLQLWIQFYLKITEKTSKSLWSGHMLLFNVQDNNMTSDMKFAKIWVSVLVSVSAKLLSLDLKDLENNIECCISNRERTEASERSG